MNKLNFNYILRWWIIHDEKIENISLKKMIENIVIKKRWRVCLSKKKKKDGEYIDI